jgi:predicted permease
LAVSETERLIGSMDIFLHILWNNVLPLSLVIGLGILLHRIFSLDIKTLSKLNFYLFSPAIMFELLYGTAISMQMFGQVLLFFVLFMLLQYAVLEVIVRLRGYKGGMRAAMRNSVLFYNSANYGIPINQLAFAGNTYTLSVQIIIMMMQSLIPNTYGIYSVNAHKADWRAIRKVILSMPVIYVIPVALLMRSFQVPLPGFVDISVGYLSDAFIGMALFTLGVQLGDMKVFLTRKLAADVGIATGLRLIAGPLLAWGVVLLLGVDDMMGAALIVSSAVPTSLSSVLLAVEFDNEKDFASQSVLVSTALSIATVTAVIYLLGV